MIEILSPMPGTISKISVTVGEPVEEKTTVLLIEAMKMINPVFADCEGIVQEIMVKEEDTVEVDQILMVVD